jgi:hypothetical protein
MTRAVTLAEIADGAVLTVDSSNSRLGIGTTNPQALLQVGTGVSVYGNSGIVSATTYYGSGANLSGITGGATLSAGSGAQRVVVTSLTSGTMTSAATDAELTYNSTSNTLSATTFSGALSGNATSATNAQGLTGTPDIAVRNITGVAATFTGVLTYEDVTNIDSVGVVTARTGIKVLAGGINAVGVVTATAFSGDGSGLSGVQAGVANFVASGTIANGATVVIKTDGTVGIVTQTGSATPSVGTPVVFNPASTSQTKIAYDSNSNRVVIAYKDTGNSNYGTAVVGTVNASNNSIAFGSEYVFRNSSINIQSLVFNPDDNKFLVCYSDGSTASQVKVLGVDVGNNIVTSNGTGGENEFSGNYSAYSRISYDTQNDKLVCIWRNTNQSDRVDAKIGTISGNSISYGSVQTFGSSINDPNLIYTKDGKTVIVYKNGSNQGAARVGTVSGTTISWGSETVFETGNTGWTQATYDSNREKVVVSYADYGNSSYGTAAVGTVSGTNITFGTPVVFDGTAGGVTNLSSTFDTNANKVVIVYQDAGNSDYGTAVVGTINSSGIISFDSGTVFESANTADTSCIFDTTSEKVIISYKDYANSQNGTSAVFSATSYVTNLTAENYIGIAAEAISNGATGKVNIVSGINEGQTGLTTAQTYYVQPNGTLATSAGTPSVVAGTSISATKIIVKG